nr:MAG TPA: hypothetical protein [Caudoviricetes sp.]
MLWCIYIFWRSFILTFYTFKHITTKSFKILIILSLIRLFSFSYKNYCILSTKNTLTSP